MKLLDLFCGAGGAAMGYHRAGFEIVGVDLAPQPHYPFTFIQADALEYLAAHGHEFDAIHASPPCQAYVTLSNRWRGKSSVADGHPQLIEPTRRALAQTDKPYLIENVMSAPLLTTIVLCGSMFGLGVRRHRKFETSWLLFQPQCRHKGQEHAGVYGPKADGGRLWTRRDGDEHRRARSLQDGQQRMGIDWMDWPELTEAIPPAYTEFIGRQLMAVWS